MNLGLYATRKASISTVMLGRACAPATSVVNLVDQAWFMGMITSGGASCRARLVRRRSTRFRDEMPSGTERRPVRQLEHLRSGSGSPSTSSARLPAPSRK
jgi:hypothetical protein